MILVVEGPSAAGKTTWCRQHTAAAVTVAEYTPTGGEPDGSDLPAQAAFWTTVNVARWAQALATEARAGIAVCDTDPLKLHYSWSLARIGAAPRARFDHELTQAARPSPSTSSASPTWCSSPTRRWMCCVRTATPTPRGADAPSTSMPASVSPCGLGTRPWTPWTRDESYGSCPPTASPSAPLHHAQIASTSPCSTR